MYSRAKTTEKFNYAWITLIMNFHDQHFSVDYCNYRKLYDKYLSSIVADPGYLDNQLKHWKNYLKNRTYQTPVALQNCY